MTASEKKALAHIKALINDSTNPTTTTSTTRFIIERERIRTAGSWIATGSESTKEKALAGMAYLKGAFYGYPNWRIIEKTTTITTRQVAI